MIVRMIPMEANPTTTPTIVFIEYDELRGTDEVSPAVTGTLHESSGECSGEGSNGGAASAFADTASPDNREPHFLQKTWPGLLRAPQLLQVSTAAGSALISITPASRRSQPLSACSTIAGLRM